MVIFLHELKQYLQKRYEGPLNIDELPDFLRNFVKNFTKKDTFLHFSADFGPLLNPSFGRSLSKMTIVPRDSN